MPKINLKNIKVKHYLLFALFLHIAFFIYSNFIIIIAPMSHEVQFKSNVIARPREPLTKAQPRVDKPVPTVQNIPARIIPTPPQVKKRVIVRDPVKAPPVAVKVPEIKPKDLEIAKVKKIDIEKIKTDVKMEREKSVRQFAQKFDISGKGKEIEATFTPVLATYSGGDWNINPTAIPNLMLEITRRTNVKATLSPITVRVDSPEIVKSPFVYFTGTQDFTLTEAEVENLRKYLLQGGAVYADNSLPGRRSRFDIAFRREMARVLPQYPLKPISPDHPIFTTVYRIKGTPVGMNWRCDPIEVIEIHGRTAAIYTLNDYGDLWETRFTKEGKVDTDLDEHWQWVWGPHWEHGGYNFLYENVNQESIDQAYQLGVNIISYFLMELKR